MAGEGARWLVRDLDGWYIGEVKTNLSRCRVESLDSLARSVC